MRTVYALEPFTADDIAITHHHLRRLVSDLSWLHGTQPKLTLAQLINFNNLRMEEALYIKREVLMHIHSHFLTNNPMEDLVFCTEIPDWRRRPFIPADPYSYNEISSILDHMF